MGTPAKLKLLKAMVIKTSNTVAPVDMEEVVENLEDSLLADSMIHTIETCSQFNPAGKQRLAGASKQDLRAVKAHEFEPCVDLPTHPTTRQKTISAAHLIYDGSEYDFCTQ